MRKNTHFKHPDLFLSTAAVFLLTVLILVYPARSLFFACNGLNLWFQKMIPALFPFMVLSGVMIRMNLTDSFVKLLKPVLSPLFQVSGSCLYAVAVGFLCGFPMGAVVTAQLYERDKITEKEAEFLLSFCNNIGPVYFLSFALPLIGVRKPLPFLFFGMYGIPFLYGLLLRHTLYRHSLSRKGIAPISAGPVPSFLQALDESVMSSLTGITKLGGYMIVFNLLNLIPELLFTNNASLRALLSAFLEITGGLKALGGEAPLASLSLLIFGGLSCIAQTSSSLQHTGLSLKKYVFHKTVLTVICAFYYFLLIGKAS